MKKIINLIFLCLTTTVFAQNQYNPTPQTWTINFESIACDNTSTNECLLIKFPGKKEYEIFSDNIEGFNFEKGNVYVISVKQELKQPPIAANESIFKYVLLKIISKKPINNIPVNETPVTSTSKIIYDINFEQVPCEDGKYCLLVKEKGKKEFEIFTKKNSWF